MMFYMKLILENKTKNYRVSVRRLCFILCATAKAYYSKHKEQFDFFNFTIFDIEKHVALIACAEDRGGVISCDLNRL